MSQNEIIEEVLDKSTNRRGLLKKLAWAAAAVGARVQAQTPPAQGPAPGDVIQFALNLEYLEAEFYSLATTGMTLAQQGVGIAGSGTPGPTTTQFNFGPVNFSTGAAFRVAQNIAADEINHVILLRAALTANKITPIAKPAINLDALAGLGASLANQQGFFLLSRIFEDIGVSAYSGAAGFLAGSPYLATAARILAVEGEHVGNIRYQSALLGLPSTPLDAADVVPPPSTNTFITTSGSTSSSSSTGSNTLPVTTSTTIGSNFFSTNLANGLCAIRTPGQVLYLAYGNAINATSGGFFPNGVNGVINTSTSAAPASNLS